MKKIADDPSKFDWSRFDAMTDEDVLGSAIDDPDNPPMTDEQLSKSTAVSSAKHLRWHLRLTQQEFSARYQIPLGTLRDWEQHRSEPDQATRAYLKVIAADPDMVARALASKSAA